jgi:hypothetical protein
MNKRILNLMGIVIMLFFMLGFSPSERAFVDCATSVVEIPVFECNALVDLYQGTEGSQWTNHTNWLFTDTPSNWYGVTITSGHVTMINLRNNNLIKPIPTSLEKLTFLSVLFLDGNSLTGSIPWQLGNITTLTSLSLTSNDLTGSIPPEFSNLVYLYNLDLRDNELTGTIPAELGSLVII